MTSAAHPTPSTAPPPSPAAGERWTRVLVGTVARGYLALVACALLWAAAPTLLGWHTTVVSSGSMTPRMPVGAMLVASPRPTESLRLGQVVLAHDPANPGRLYSHRYVGKTPDGDLITRGDANGADDSSPLPTRDVLGTGRLLVPYAGLPTLWLRTGDVPPLAAWLVVTAVAVAVVQGDRTRTRAGHPGQRRRRPGTAALATAAAAGVAVVAVLAAGTARPLSLAAYRATTTNPGDAFALDPRAQFGAGDYDKAVQADNPSLFWHLDENPATGQALDSTKGPKNPGAYTPTGVTGGQPGPLTRETSAAVRLDGTAGCVVSTRTVPAGALSLEAWFKTTTTTGGKIVGLGNSTGTASSAADRHIYMTDAGTLRWGVNPGTPQTVATVASYNDGLWHHVVGTLGNAGQALYVDGVLQASSANTAASSTAAYVHVGCDTLTGWPAAPTSSFFAGQVADVAYYSTALSATKVAAHFYAA